MNSLPAVLAAVAIEPATSITDFPTGPHISLGTFVLFDRVTVGYNLRAEDTLKSIFYRYDLGVDNSLTGSGPSGFVLARYAPPLEAEGADC